MTAHRPEAATTPAEEDGSGVVAPAEKPRNRAARLTQIIVAGVGVFCLLVAGVTAYVAWPRIPAEGPAAEVPAEYQPWVEAEYTEPTDPLWTDMNRALSEKNREAFLASASGEAAGQLAQWWDNTTAIGWDIAAITPLEAPDDAGEMTVMLGAQFAFAAHPPRGAGNPDAGLRLIQGFQYTLTLSPSADPEATDRTILSIVPTYEPNPWDEGPIHVAKREHSVLFGMADEAALVEANADVAERGAVIALDKIRELGGDLPQDGFVSAITGDDQRFARWQYGTGTPWEMDVAGFARPTSRPPTPERWLDPMIATGPDTSGTLVVMGPKSSDQREKTFVHEFAHALHHTAAPGSFADPPAAVMEGFARYVEWASGVSEPEYVYAEVKDAVAQRGTEAFNDESLRSQDAGIAYAAAGSYYAFVAERGGSAWDLAVRARTTPGGLVAQAEASPEYSIAAWQQWVAAQ